MFKLIPLTICDGNFTNRSSDTKYSRPGLSFGYAPAIDATVNGKNEWTGSLNNVHRRHDLTGEATFPDILVLGLKSKVRLSSVTIRYPIMQAFGYDLHPQTIVLVYLSQSSHFTSREGRSTGRLVVVGRSCDPMKVHRRVMMEICVLPIPRFI
jgi:hypothetical protein